MSEARRNHYVPQCWLAGFTENGEKDGRLYVTDFTRNKQWNTSPDKAGHQRDFYRLVESPNLEPLVYEKLLANIESDAAPIFKELDRTLTEPTVDQLEVLLVFMASQWIRVPAFRHFVLRTADSIHRSYRLKSLRSRKTWTVALKKAGVSVNALGAGYESMRDFIENHKYRLSAENDWYLYRGFTQLEGLVASLRKRLWRPFFSRNGNFIASDNPVVMDGPKGIMIGFESAEAVCFPVSRHVLLCGGLRPFRHGDRNRREIARQNTFTMLNATDQVYSHTSDFCWLDEDDAYRTEWRVFSTEKFREKGITSDLSSA
jgi:hypothetical protein